MGQSCSPPPPSLPFGGSSFSSCPLFLFFLLALFYPSHCIFEEYFLLPIFTYIAKSIKVLFNTFFGYLDFLIQLLMPQGHCEFSIPLTNLIFHSPNLPSCHSQSKSSDASVIIPVPKQKAQGRDVHSLSALSQFIIKPTFFSITSSISPSLHLYLHFVYASVTPYFPLCLDLYSGVFHFITLICLRAITQSVPDLRAITWSVQDPRAVTCPGL